MAGRNWKGQLGELKYADGEMCECLGERKDPDPRTEEAGSGLPGTTVRVWPGTPTS